MYRSQDNTNTANIANINCLRGVKFTHTDHDDALLMLPFVAESSHR